MNKTILPLALILFLAAFAGCKPTNSKATENTANPPATEVADAQAPADSACKKLIQNKVMPKSDMIDRIEAGINGDCLEMKLTFGGGCNEHLFDLYWDGSFMKPFPPQVNLRLFHDKKGDACKAIVEQEVSFDLKPIQNAEVIINLSAEGAETLKLTYK